MVTCKCGKRVMALDSYFGIPLHKIKAALSFSYEVCRLWSGL